MFLFREFTLDLYKELRASLMHIFGVGWYKSRLVAAKLGLAFPYYLAQINTYNFSVLFFLLKYLVVSDVRIKRRVESNISKKIDLQGFSGLRHKLCLPYVDKGRVLMLVHNVIRDLVLEFLALLKNNFFYDY